jgi:hypothetical protein
MAIIADKDFKEVEVKNLKNLTFPEAPGFKFFLHRSHLEKGFSITEETSGACICREQRTMKLAIEEAKYRLEFWGVKKFKTAVKNAIEKRRKANENN